MDDYNHPVRILLRIDLRTPADGPTPAEIEATARQLDRSLPNFIAFSCIWIVQRVLEEAAIQAVEAGDGEASAAYDTLQAIIDTAARLGADAGVISTRMATVMTPEDPSLTDIDEVARLAGLDRDTFISACTVANAEYQAWLLTPEGQASTGIDAAQTQAALDALPDDEGDGVAEEWAQMVAAGSHHAALQTGAEIARTAIASGLGEPDYDPDSFDSDPAGDEGDPNDATNIEPADTDAADGTAPAAFDDPESFAIPRSATS